MSPDSRRTFEAEWPELARKLNSFLARKGIGPDQREDLVQETGTRLVGMWTSVDLTRSPWSLTLTIALNLIRDRYRRGDDREIASEVPDIPERYDLEQAGLARVELARIRSALASLTASQRAAVLAEVGYGNGIHQPDSSADKMMRSRARRKLYTLIGRASAAVTIQLRKLGEFAQALVSSSEAALSGVGCAACALLAFGAVLVPHARAIETEIKPHHSGILFSTFDYSEIDGPRELGGAASRALAPVGDDYLRRDVRARRPSTRSSGLMGGNESAGSQGEPLPLPEPPIGRNPVPGRVPTPPTEPPRVGRAPEPPPTPPLPRVPAIGDDLVTEVKKIIPKL